MTVNINKPQINLREQLKKLERPTTDRLVVKGSDGVLIDKLTGELSLQGIDAMTGGTAVDVFVYDTSKDSDGGAWRKRTSHTSWYNETLSTTTRGSRKEFPAVVVIVGESNKITIYDGDDPDMPMWMEFISTSGQYGAIYNGRSPISIVAKNGEIFHADSVDSVVRWNFITDTIKSESSSGRWDSNRNIADRNPSDGTNKWTNYDSGVGLVSYPLYDIAVTVLSNAPINDATGLPFPTIAVGTTSGVSVFSDNEKVFNYTHQNTPYDVTSFVEFLSDDRVAYGWDNDTTPRRIHITPIRNADTTTVDSPSYPIDSTGTVGYGRPDDNKGVGNYHGFLVGDDQSVAAAMEESKLAVGDGADGLNFIDVQEAGVDIFDSKIAFITSNYNTGWQHGDIKGTFLSDTDTTDLTGEKINLTNGSVGAGNNASVASITANQLVFQSSSEAVGRYDTGTTLVTGKQYHATLTISNYSGSGDLGVASGGGFDATFRYSANGTYTRYITGDDASEIQLFYRNSNSATVGFSIKEIDLDRSVYPEGLIPFGTITKSAVATGAELVAYSGFSNSNYFEQPFNSIMQFGSTGDFSVSFWMKQASPATFCGIIDNGYNSSGNFYFLIGTDSNGKLFFRTSDSSGQSDKTASSQGVVTGGDWKHIVCTRTISGTQMNMFINGVLDGNSGSVTARNVTNSLNQPLKIGNRSNSTDRFFTGSLALVRVSGSAPSPAEVKKMYEDEKSLYQENAACTLYGTSDAVTALSYDTTTKSLHAGTSSGRSEFKGLRRVSNTTTGVTTAISASNGLVAEQ